MIFQACIERTLSGMTERRMTEVMRESKGFGQVFIEAELPREGPRDLRNFQTVGQARAVMVALVENKDLCLMLEAPKCGRMDDAVTIAAERAAMAARRLIEAAAPAFGRIAAIGSGGSRPSDGHTAGPSGFIDSGVVST
jgi:hypothetical protein